MHAIIFAGGTLRPGEAVQRAITTADLVVAADKGASTALRYGCTPKVVVGDFDSLPVATKNTLEHNGVRLIQVAAAKNETDTELAVQTAIDAGASTITLLGGLGGARFDHTIANTFLLVGFTLPMRIVDGPTTCWLLRGGNQSTVVGHASDLLSLFPLAGDAVGIHTTNLLYALNDDTLFFGKPRGISNVLTHDQAGVSLRHGLLLIMHTSQHELQES
jgi:thiamine pyrophosphokinase